MPDFFDYPNKTCNIELCQPIVLFCDSEEPRKIEDCLNRAAAWPMSIGQGFVSGDIKNHYFKAKFFGGIQVYLQCFVKVVVDKSRKMAWGVLNILEKSKFLRHWHSKLCF